MSTYVHNNTSYHHAPKNAGTTMREWILFAQKGIRGPWPEKLEELGYYNGFFDSQTTRVRYCIKRDPVDRFISMITNKRNRPGFSALSDIDAFLDNFDAHVLAPLAKCRTNYNNDMAAWHAIKLARHAAPQTLMLGAEKSYYTHVFAISEVNTRLREFLEDVVFKKQLPQIRANQHRGEKILLSPQQRRRVAEVYACDYEAGWS